MEYAKDEIYDIKYKKEDKNKAKESSIIKLLLSIGLIFSVANIIVIYNFFKILSNI